jgi:cellobiose transport system permease protein
MALAPVTAPSAESSAGTPSAPRRGRTGRAEPLVPYLYISPFFLLFLAFGIIPLIFTGWVSLHDWQLLGTHRWVGVRNYGTMFDDPRFWQALRNTLVIFVISTGPQLVLSVALASVLGNRGLRARTFWRMALLVPNITPLVTVALVFGSIFGRDYGLMAWLLKLVHLPPVDWGAGSVTAQVVIALMVTWRWTGYNALIYLAAMQNVPRELHEAAEIDGASRWKDFVYVTIPMIRPTIIFSVITSTIGGLQIFTEPLLFTSPTGGSSGQGLTMTLFLYGQAFNSFKFGYASAIAVTLLFVIAMIALVNFAVARLIRSA